MEKQVLKDLLKVSLRNSAMLVPFSEQHGRLNTDTQDCRQELFSLGFDMTERLLMSFNCLPKGDKQEYMEAIREIMGIGLNWMPLVRDWTKPSPYSSRQKQSDVRDLSRCLKRNKKYRKPIIYRKLPCGHYITKLSAGILNHYNGCPICKRMFTYTDDVFKGQSDERRLLDVWTGEYLHRHLVDLIEAPMIPDATMRDSLKILLHFYGVPKIEQFGSKEAKTLVIDELVSRGEWEKAGSLIKRPSEIFKFLWYRKTGILHFVQPRKIIKDARRNAWSLDKGIKSHPEIAARDKKK